MTPKPTPARRPLRPKRLLLALSLLLATLWLGRLFLVRQMVLPRMVLHQPTPRLKSSLRWPDDLTVASVAISPDGSEIFSGSSFPFADPADKHDTSDRRFYNPKTPVPICVWDARTGRLRRQLLGHTRLVDALACSPDGKWLASSGWDGTVRLWDVKTGRQIWSRPGNTPALTFSPDSRLLAVDATVWHVSDGQPVRTYNGRINQTAGVAFSPDGKTFVCVTAETKVVFSPPGQPFSMRTVGERAQLWNVTTGKLLRTLPYDLMQSAAFSPDGASLICLSRLGSAAGTDGAELSSVDVQTGREKWNWSLDNHADGSFLGLTTLAYSPNGKWVVGEASKHDFFLFDAATGRLARRLHPLEWSQIGSSRPTPSGLGFSRDGNTLVGRGLHTVQVWDTSTLR